MADRDIWEKGESLSKIFAAVLIPVVIGIAGLYANQALEKSKTRDELLKQAIDVVFLSKSDQMAGADKSFESRQQSSEPAAIQEGAFGDVVPIHDRGAELLVARVNFPGKVIAGADLGDDVLTHLEKSLQQGVVELQDFDSALVPQLAQP